MARGSQGNKRIIGIDLGTTNSVVAVMEGDRPVIVPNSEGGRVTPSVVAFTPKGELLVGQLARRQAILHPSRTVASIKRKMGSSEIVHIDQDSYTPQQISAMILSKLKADTELYLGEPVSRAVITVPAYFNDAQRQATKDAGQLAGLEVVRIINEPTAASLAYGIDKQQQETLLVWDLGGGTFDVSLLVAGDGVFEVRATSGDTFLGGDDYDRVIVDYLARQFMLENTIDLRNDLQAHQRLLDAAERAKIELSTLTSTSITLPFIYADAQGPKHLEVELTRAEFEQMTASLTQRLRDPFESALTDARMQPSALDQVLLVGGSTRMPAITQMVRTLTNKQPNQSINPDEVVALGAAIQGGVLSGELAAVLLIDVTPLSLGVEIVDGKVHRLVERNTPLPIRYTEEFTTSYDGQPDVEIHVVQGEGSNAFENFSLGRFRLDGIVPSPRGEPRIAVAFDIDVNGMVTVSATDEASGNSQRISLIARGTVEMPTQEILLPTDFLTATTGMLNQQTTSPHRTVDSTIIPPFATNTVQRAETLIAQAQWMLTHANPPLSFLEKTAVDSALQRVRQVRMANPFNEQQLSNACDDLETLSQRISQWPSARSY